MPSANKTYLVLLSAVSAIVVLTLLRLVIPYSFEDKRSILPEVYSTEEDNHAGQYLADILEHNLWDESRAPLEYSVVSSGSGRLAEDGSQPTLHEVGQTSPLILVGVSSTDEIAVIESSQGIGRYPIGATLPDGSTLEEILEYGVRLSNSGESQRLYLFGKN